MPAYSAKHPMPRCMFCPLHVVTGFSYSYEELFWEITYVCTQCHHYSVENILLLLLIIDHFAQLSYRPTQKFTILLVFAKTVHVTFGIHDVLISSWCPLAGGVDGRCEGVLVVMMGM